MTSTSGEATPKQDLDLAAKESDKGPLKNQNPNKNHNSKKVSLGPNTKR